MLWLGLRCLGLAVGVSVLGLELGLGGCRLSFFCVFFCISSNST